LPGRGWFFYHRYDGDNRRDRDNGLLFRAPAILPMTAAAVLLRVGRRCRLDFAFR